MQNSSNNIWKEIGRIAMLPILNDYQIVRKDSSLYGFSLVCSKPLSDYCVAPHNMKYPNRDIKNDIF